MYQLLRQVARVGIRTEAPPAPDEALRAARQALGAEVLRLFQGALAIRHVDAGSCNGCEQEIHAVNNLYYNLEGLGIKFVASPRHADLLLVTGPVSRHMELALQRTYDATPDPKLVVAIGECACTGGIFGESYASRGRVSNVIPVDVAVPGCPPTPAAIMQGILTAISRGANQAGNSHMSATAATPPGHAAQAIKP
jgi:Ni,Fe-hydrogenase III small subunit